MILNTRVMGALTALASLIGSHTALAGEIVDVTRAAPAAGEVHVENVRGEIRIKSWDREEVRVEGELDDLAEDLVLEVQDGRTLIRVKMPERNINRGDGSDLTIHLPAASSLRVEAVSADVSVEHMRGPISVRTVSGDVRGEGMSAATQINTVSGDVELSDGSGRVDIVTVSGDADLELEARAVTVDTMSGDVELALGSFDSLEIRAVNGEFEISGHLNAAGRIDGSTVNGDIELRLDHPVNARIDVRTGPGGEIDNELTGDRPEERFPDAMELSTEIGDGSGGIRLVTVNGDIRLEGR